jgi:hypothetical protein
MIRLSILFFAIAIISAAAGLNELSQPRRVTYPAPGDCPTDSPRGS